MLKELYLLWLRLAAPQDLHYINGADTLPPPLPPEQERAALDALTRGQPQARDLLTILFLGPWLTAMITPSAWATSCAAASGFPWTRHAAILLRALS